MWRDAIGYLFQTDRPGFRQTVIWMWRLLFAGIALFLLLFFLLSFSNLPSVS